MPGAAERSIHAIIADFNTFVWRHVPVAADQSLILTALTREARCLQWDNPSVSAPTQRTRPTVLALWLIIAGAIGWWAAFQLMLEKLHGLANPGAAASCDFSVIVQCSANLDSLQGSVLGFPNPIIGLTAWMAPVVVGFAILAGARFANWFWWAFELGMLLGFVFVIWLITQSIFVLGTLCPWCMITWLVMIPSYYAVTIHLFRSGVFPVSAKARRGAERMMGWVPVFTVVSYAIIAIIAELRLSVLATLF